MIRVMIAVSMMGLFSTLRAMNVDFTLADGVETVSAAHMSKFYKIGYRRATNYPTVSRAVFLEIISGLDALESNPKAFIAGYKKRPESEFRAFLNALIELGMDKSITEIYNQVTSEKGYASTAGYLIGLIHNINIRDETNTTALIRASKAGLNDVVRLLLTKDTSGINYADGQGRTALHWAASEGFVDCAKLLLQARADIYCEDRKGSMPLHEAGKAGHVEMVNLLITSGADINAQGEEGRTVLMEACRLGRVHVVRALFKSKNDLSRKCYIGGKWYTALDLAALNGHVDVVKAFLKRYNGIDVSSAFCAAIEGGHKEIVAFLLEAGADLNAPRQDLTPLMCAAQKGDVEILNLLLGARVSRDSKVKIDKTTYDEVTALMHAAKAGKAEAVKVLLRAGAMVDYQDDEGKTALLYATEAGHVDVVKALLQGGARVDQQFDGHDSRFTALLLACDKNHLEVVKALLQSGANVDYQLDNGITALMIATENGDKDLVSLLLSWYARTDLAAKDGHTALTLATAKGNKDIEELIRKGPSKRRFTLPIKAVLSALAFCVVYKIYATYGKTSKIEDGPALEAGPQIS